MPETEVEIHPNSQRPAFLNFHFFSFSVSETRDFIIIQIHLFIANSQSDNFNRIWSSWTLTLISPIVVVHVPCTHLTAQVGKIILSIQTFK